MFAVVIWQITNKSQRTVSPTNELKIKNIILSYLSRSIISRIINVCLKNYMYLNKNIFIFGFFKWLTNNVIYHFPFSSVSVFSNEGHEIGSLWPLF